MLTAKQAAFVREYLVDRNATQAAIRAGYSQDTAYSIGHENLNKPEIKNAIAAEEGRLQERADMNVARVAQMLLEDRAMARELGQPSAAVSASMGIAKLYGLLVDKVESENVNRNYVIADQPEEMDADTWMQKHASHGGPSPDHKQH